MPVKKKRKDRSTHGVSCACDHSFLHQFVPKALAVT